MTMVHNNYNPATTIVAFDLHGVVCTLDYWQICKLALRNPGSILRLALYSFNPFFLKKVWDLWRSHSVAAAYLQMVELQYPFLKPTIPFLIAVGNAQIPNLPLINFIKVSQQRGYAVHLFSNIGDIILEDFITKHPEVIALFDAVCNTHKSTGYVGKPYDAAFIKYQTHYNPTGKRVIFIDNTKRNIAAAKYHGMTGIFYVNTPDVIQKISRLLVL